MKISDFILLRNALINKIALPAFWVVAVTTIIFLASCSNSTVKQPTQSTLSMEAAIIYKMDGVKPIARGTFYLLDSSAEEILKSANLKPQSKNLDRILKLGQERGMPTDTLTYLDFLKIAYDSPKEYGSYLLQVTNEMKKRNVKTVMTDLQGKAQFEGIERKTYYIFGTAQTRGGSAIWNLPIEVKEEKQSIILDQNNAFRAD